MASTPHPRSPRDRVFRIAFVVLLVLQCLPFWIFSYTHSPAGPAHLHNLTVTPAGNMSTQFLLTSYVILLFLSFRYLLHALTPHAEPFFLFAGPLTDNPIIPRKNYAALTQLESRMPGFNIAHYEQQTRGRAQLAGFARIASNPKNRIHLYQRLRPHLEQ